MLLAETDAEAEAALKNPLAHSPLPMPAGVRDALIKLDSRNVAGETRTPNVGGALPTNFFGGPDTVIDQIKRCRDQAGIGVLDLFFQTRDAHPETLLSTLTLFGEKVLPHIREV